MTFSVYIRVISCMTLYRKYRPQSFAEVVGQEHVKGVILEEIKSSHIAHAYLFSGPRGTGKTTLARLFAKALNCQNRAPDGEPCNQCSSCQEITAGRSQDLVEIDAASNRRIDEMRQLREEVKYVPARDLYKVYIIDEAHMLTAEAFNAFLKTLEEPPGHIVFILATTELAKIPETIFSRCQHFSFTKLPFTQVLGRLQSLSRQEGVAVEADVLEEVARKSGGALRDAESLLGQILSLGKKEISQTDASLFLPKVGFEKVFAWLEQLGQKNTRLSLEQLSDLERTGVNLEFFLEQALELSRQLLLYKVTAAKENLEWYFSKDEASRLDELSKTITLGAIRSIAVNLLKAKQEMRLAPDLPILPIELAVVAICEEGEKRTEDSGQRTGSEKGMPGSRKESENGKWKMENGKDSFRNSDPPRADRIALSLKESSLNEPTSRVNSHSLEDIISGWGEVLTRVKDKNHALNFILGVAEPIGVNGNTVELGFKYRLQQEKVSEFKNREIIETVIEEVYGSKYQIQASLKEDLQINRNNGKELAVAVAPSDEEILVKTALEVFEGAVVEN